jgi:glycosyltransferase involved in cell wall biosynthesis
MYDCLFPWTVGGGERWLRNVAERLAAEGHEVTYLTLTQWERGAEPDLPGIRVIGIGRKHLELYDGERRKIGPPLRFGAGVLWHLLRHGRQYDVVHTSSFPFFSLLAAGVARRVGGYRIACDWFEVWSKQYWRAYLGPKGGPVGYAIQRACTHIKQEPHVLSNMHGERLTGLNRKLRPLVLTGLYAGSLDAPEVIDPPADPVIVYAGRHTQEKRVPQLVAALAEAHRQRPSLKATLFGDGPYRAQVLAEIERLGLQGVVEAPGFVDQEVLAEAMRTASCIVQPSDREGYGLVVVEAATNGVPVVVVDGPDNAATELVEPGLNGEIAASIDPPVLAEAILRAVDGGTELRRTTVQWLERNRERLSLDRSLAMVATSYER